MNECVHGFYPANCPECPEDRAFSEVYGQIAFRRHWDNDPYAVARTAALNWLGDRYLLAAPINVRRG